MSDTRLEPGMWVHLPAMADWGLGQVQSVVGSRVTVNFENAGKQLINISVAELVLAAMKEEKDR
ncbi:MAG: DUF3553 domain-containing protein [Alphaproteobacteria bacterium]|nr:DUF3553 domain-containing protein [Alphaproteobacteria bacterium]